MEWALVVRQAVGQGFVHGGEFLSRVSRKHLVVSLVGDLVASLVGDLVGDLVVTPTRTA